RCSLPVSRNASSDFSANVDITGAPWTQEFPSSMTIEPVGVRYSLSKPASPLSHFVYSSPFLLPYFFFRLSGKGGDVKIKSTRPLYSFANRLSASVSSAVPMYRQPRFDE